MVPHPVLLQMLGVWHLLVHTTELFLTIKPGKNQTTSLELHKLEHFFLVDPKAVLC